MQCGSCSQDVVQAIPLLLNPVTWLVALTAITTIVSKTTKKKDK